MPYIWWSFNICFREGGCSLIVSLYWTVCSMFCDRNKTIWSICNIICVIQIKYVLSSCVTCPIISMHPRSLNPGTSWGRRWCDPGIRSVRILGQVTQFWQTILNLFYSTGSLNSFWCHLPGIQWQRESLSSRSPSHRHYYNYQYFYYYNYQFIQLYDNTIKSMTLADR